MSKQPFSRDFLLTPYSGKFSSILLFGPPGAGKGTLGKFLANAGTQYHLSSGDIFRSLPSDSTAGKLFYSYASQGLLLPDDATIEIWKYYVQGLIATNSYYPEMQDLLLDGIPRTLKQAQMIENYVSVRHIILLEVSDNQKLIDRLRLRSIREGRIDLDYESIIKKRIEVYEKEIDAIIDYYPSHLISKVNANQKPLEILRDVLVRLSHLLSHGPNFP